jgi:hypothetical protein
MRTVFFALVALLALSACSSSPEHKLDVQIVTGLVGGAEFNRVKTEVFRTRGDSNYVVTEAEAVAYFGPAYARGVRVASFPALPSGDYTVRVTLVRPNGLKLIEQPLRFMLENDFVARVYLDRGCVGVECPNPGGSAALAACLGGSCVDPRCNPEDPSTLEYCPSTLCENDSQCENAAACATSYCASGVCITEPIASGEGACAEGEWCNPEATENACQDVPDSTLLESDAGVDGGNALCGRICQGTPTACVTGFFWDCEGGEPVCTPFIFAPSGTGCGEGECDGRGVCSSSIDGGIDAAVDAFVCPLEDPIELVNEGSDHDDLESSGARKIAFFRADHAPAEPVTVTMEVLTPDVCSADPDHSTRTFDATNWDENTDVRVLWTRDGLVTGTRECRVRVLAPCAAPIEAVVRIRDVDFERLTLRPDGSELSEGPQSLAQFPSVTLISDDGRYVYVSTDADGLVAPRAYLDVVRIYRFDRERDRWQYVPVANVPFGTYYPFLSDPTAATEFHKTVEAIDPTGTRIAVAVHVVVRDATTESLRGYYRQMIVCDVSALDDLDEDEFVSCTTNRPVSKFRSTETPLTAMGRIAEFVDSRHVAYLAVDPDDGNGFKVAYLELPETFSAPGLVTPSTLSYLPTVPSRNSLFAGISPSGRYTAFLSRDGNVDDLGADGDLAQNEAALYLRDNNDGAVRFVRVVYVDNVDDSNYGTSEQFGLLNVHFSEGEAGLFGMYIENDGEDGFEPSTSGVYYYDIAEGTMQTLGDRFTGLPSTSQFTSLAQTTRDGRYVAWTSVAYDESDSLTGMDAYIGDTRTGQWYAVSNFGDPTAPSGFSVLPTITNDGRFVVFPTTNDSLAAGDTNRQFDLLLGAAFD